MRIVGILLVICLVGAGTGCKNKGSADAASDPETLKAQQELIARRDKLLQARKKLQADRDAVKQQVQTKEANNEDATEEKKKLAELDSQLETQTSDLVTMLSSKVDEIKAGGDKAANVAAREAGLAAREQSIADREASLAKREQDLMARDAAAAKMWKESCNTGAAPVIIQQAAPPKSGNYTNKDITALIGKARSAMSKKGLITSDLPGPAQSLESEATAAMADNDMGKAYLAAAQLVANVDAIQVNRAFIQAKTNRLSAQVKGAKLDEATQKELAQILGDVMSAYNNGDFGAANRRLNSLATKLANK